MNGMREFLSGNLARGLQAMPAVDRLTVAWPVVCGTAMARHGRITDYAEGFVHIAVSDAGWMRQMRAMQNRIAAELGRIAGVPVAGIHFQQERVQGELS